MTLSEPMLQKLVTPQPQRKGATEEHIFVANQKARKNAELIASLKKTPVQGK